MALETVDLKTRVGSEIKIGRQDLLNGRVSPEIRKLLEQRGVIVFHGVDFDDDDLKTFGVTLGEVVMNGYEGTKDTVTKVSLDPSKQRGENAGLFKGTFYWHMDGMNDEVPPLASILSPRALSETGGQTEFANTYAAYEDLSEEMKAKIEGLVVHHSTEAAYRKMISDPTEEQIAFWRSRGHMFHPLVWTHRTGRKSIVNGITTDYVVGMDRDEGRALLTELLEHATQPQYVYHHQWQMGDMVMWDNTGTMHRVLHYEAESGRALHRLTLVGEESLAVTV